MKQGDIVGTVGQGVKSNAFPPGSVLLNSTTGGLWIRTEGTPKWRQSGRQSITGLISSKWYLVYLPEGYQPPPEEIKVGLVYPIGRLMTELPIHSVFVLDTGFNQEYSYYHSPSGWIRSMPKSGPLSKQVDFLDAEKKKSDTSPCRVIFIGGK